MEMIHIRQVLWQPLSCQDPDPSSVIFTAAIHNYLLQVGPLRKIRNQHNIGMRHIIGSIILHIVVVYLSLAVVWDTSGCLIQKLLAYRENSNLPQYMNLIRLSMAITFLLSCWNLPKKRKNCCKRSAVEMENDNDYFDFFSVWDAFPSEIRLGSLGLRYTERFPRPREPPYNAVARSVYKPNKYV